MFAGGGTYTVESRISNFHRVKQKVRDSGLNAEGTDVFVRDSAIFEIAHVRDSETPL